MVHVRTGLIIIIMDYTQALLSILSCRLQVRILAVLVCINQEGDALLIDLAGLHCSLVLAHIDLIAKLVVEDNSPEGRADRLTEALHVSAQS